VNPAHITYSWYPLLQDPKLGLGPTGDYWVRGIAGRSQTSMATIDVTSNVLPDPVVTTQESESADVPGDPTPALVIDNRWTVGKAPVTSRTMKMTLTNVSEIGIDMARTQLHDGGTVTATTDGATTLRLLNLVPGATVRAGSVVVRADRTGTAVVQLAKGTDVVVVG
jgi:hypothetical protein